MAITDKTYYIGEIGLAINSINETEFNSFVETIEKRYLINLLGYDLYKSYLAGITATTQKYIDLRDGKEYTTTDGEGRTVYCKWEGLADMFKYFVYYEWQRAVRTVNSSGGEKFPKDENSDNASSILLNTKIVNAYNTGISKYGYDITKNNYYNRYYKDYYSEIIKGTAFNFLYLMNEAKSEYYPNWNFSQLSEINIMGI